MTGDWDWNRGKPDADIVMGTNFRIHRHPGFAYQ
jgi:hypothetical protein